MHDLRPLQWWPESSTQDVWAASVTETCAFVCFLLLSKCTVCTPPNASVCIKLMKMLFMLMRVRGGGRYKKRQDEEADYSLLTQRQTDRHNLLGERPINLAKVKFLLDELFLPLLKLPFLLPLFFLLSSLSSSSSFLSKEVLTIAGRWFLSMGGKRWNLCVWMRVCVSEFM